EVVFLTLKTHALPALAPALGAARGAEAGVVSAQDGIRWRYFEDRHLESVDPGAVTARSIPYRSVLVCVVCAATTDHVPSVVELPLSVEKRLEGAAATGDHRTSMLQDLELKRPLEIDALLGAVIELAAASGVEVPSLKAVYGLTKLLDEVNRGQS